MARSQKSLTWDLVMSHHSESITTSKEMTWRWYNVDESQRDDQNSIESHHSVFGPKRHAEFSESCQIHETRHSGHTRSQALSCFKAAELLQNVQVSSPVARSNVFANGKKVPGRGRTHPSSVLFTCFMDEGLKGAAKKVPCDGQFTRCSSNDGFTLSSILSIKELLIDLLEQRQVIVDLRSASPIAIRKSRTFTLKRR